MNKYFNGVDSKDQLKKMYRALCRELQPDAGGSHEAFIEMKREYDHLAKYGTFTRERTINWDDIFSGFKSRIDNKQIIDMLIRMQFRRGHKKGWVYYAFVDEAVDPTMSDFEYLAEKLGYKPGWAYFKHREYYE